MAKRKIDKATPLTDEQGNVRELSQADLNAGVSLSELPAAMQTALKSIKKRGRPKLEDTKQQVTLRLDKDIIEAFKAYGEGWQTRINLALRSFLALDSCLLTSNATDNLLQDSQGILRNETAKLLDSMRVDVDPVSFAIAALSAHTCTVNGSASILGEPVFLSMARSAAWPANSISEHCASAKYRSESIDSSKSSFDGGILKSASVTIEPHMIPRHK